MSEFGVLFYELINELRSLITSGWNELLLQYGFIHSLFVIMFYIHIGYCVIYLFWKLIVGLLVCGLTYDFIFSFSYFDDAMNEVEHSSMASRVPKCFIIGSICGLIGFSILETYIPICWKYMIHQFQICPSDPAPWLIAIGFILFIYILYIISKYIVVKCQYYYNNIVNIYNKIK